MDKMTERKLLGRRVKRLRTELDMDQYQFAREVGVSQGSICKWERGELAPTFSSILKMSRQFKEIVNLEYFNIDEKETQDVRSLRK